MVWNDDKRCVNCNNINVKSPYYNNVYCIYMCLFCLKFGHTLIDLIKNCHHAKYEKKPKIIFKLVNDT